MTQYEPSIGSARPSVIEHLSLIRNFERKILRNPQNEIKEKKLNWYYIFFVVIPCIASICLAGLGYYLNVNSVKIAALVALVIGHFGLIGTPLVGIWYYRADIGEFFKNPSVPLQKSAQATFAAFEHFIPVLINYSKSELDLSVAALKVERDALERRSGVVVGAIDKVGVIPSFITAVIAITKLSADDAGKSGWTDLFFGAAFVLFGLYIVAAFAHNKILQIDKMLRLLDLVIEKKGSYKFNSQKK